MFLLSVILSALLAPALTRPQEKAPLSPLVANGPESSSIPIVNQTDEANPDGSFQFSYETANGIKVEEKGYVKEGRNASEKIQVIEGNVVYTDVEGNVINLRYIADENGYQPIGDHIPQSAGVPQGDARSGKSLSLQSVPQTVPSPSSIQTPQKPEITTQKVIAEPVEKATTQSSVEQSQTTVQP
nr:larval cuticle protein 1-like [Leptinotarsa decemlineata]